MSLSVATSPTATLSRQQMVIAILAGGLLLFHLLANAFTAYGLFRDELYYLACSHRLAGGYVDHPPLSIGVLAVVRWLLGDSLLAIRLVPALALSATVVVTGLMVQRMRGGVWAIVLSGTAVILAPIFLAMGTYYSMNSLDILLWSVAAYQVLRIIEQPTTLQRWIVLGIIIGLGLLNKVSFLWFGASLLVGLLLSPLRPQLITPRPYLAGGIALLMFLPFIVWNVQHDFAHLEFMQNALQNKYRGINRIDFLQGVLLSMNPINALVWLAGLYFYFFTTAGRPYRILGIIFLTTFLILLVNGNSKSEYLAPAFPMLLAGGGVGIVHMAQRLSVRWLPATVIALLIPTLAFVPLAVPLLPPDTYVAYAQKIGLSTKNSEGKATAKLPQFFADMFGWEALAQNVAAVYQGLPAAERAKTSIYTQNYGEAGALEYYQAEYNLPPVVSGHNNYWLWGYGSSEPNTMIIVGGEKADHLLSFKEVEQVAVHRADFVMPYENNLPIFVCRGLRMPAAEIWPNSKHYD